MSRYFYCRREEAADSCFGLATNNVAFFDRELTVQFEMKLDEGSVAGIVSSQIVYTLHVGTRQHSRSNALPFVIRHFTIKQLLKEMAGSVGSACLRYSVAWPCSRIRSIRARSRAGICRRPAK